MNGLRVVAAHLLRRLTPAGVRIRRTLELAVAAPPSAAAGPARPSPAEAPSAGGPDVVPAPTHTPAAAQGGQAPLTRGAGGRRHVVLPADPLYRAAVSVPGAVVEDGAVIIEEQPA